MAKVFRSKRDGKVVVVVGVEEDLVKVHAEGEPEDSIRVVKTSTLKRWYEPVEEVIEETSKETSEEISESVPVSEETSVSEEVVEEILISENTVSSEDIAEQNESISEQSPDTSNKEVKKPRKTPTKKTPNPEVIEVCKNFMDFICEKAKQSGVVIFNAPKQNHFYSLKVDDKMYMAFTVSDKSGITLWLRSSAVEGICEYKRMNHMFDARVAIQDWSPDTLKRITELHDASLKYQMDKKSKTKKTK